MIIVGHGYALVIENTTSGIIPNSNAIMGTVVDAELSNGYCDIDDVIMYNILFFHLLLISIL